MDRPRRRTGLILASLASAACDDEHLLATASLGAQFEVVSWDGYASEARAVLRDRNHVPVILPPSDEVQITNQDWQVKLVPRTVEGWYGALVPSVPVEPWHNFAVLREGRPSAGYNEVQMPPDPLPVVPPAWSRAGELVVGWAGIEAVEPIRLVVEGRCLDEVVVVEVPDAPGVHAFAAGAISGTGSCEVDLTVSRGARAGVDDEFRGGAVEAWQHRLVVLTSDP